uniref:MCC-bdg_PDZ domain-containing protein n=1 Tax=Rhabditophanes sp. KR3021 TaxID=114890 RepID=A0AC35U1F3_9BILA
MPPRMNPMFNNSGQMNSMSNNCGQMMSSRMNSMQNNCDQMMQARMNPMLNNCGQIMQSQMNLMQNNCGQMNPISSYRGINPNVTNIAPVNHVCNLHLEDKLKSAEEKISLLESKLDKYHHAFTEQTNKYAVMREDIDKLVSNALDSQHITTSELKQYQILNATHEKLKDDHTRAIFQITTLTNQNGRLENELKLVKEKVRKQRNELAKMSISFEQKSFLNKKATDVSDDFEFVNSGSM